MFVFWADEFLGYVQDLLHQPLQAPPSMRTATTSSPTVATTVCKSVPRRAPVPAPPWQGVMVRAQEPHSSTIPMASLDAGPQRAAKDSFIQITQITAKLEAPQVRIMDPSVNAPAEPPNKRHQDPVFVPASVLHHQVCLVRVPAPLHPAPGATWHKGGQWAPRSQRKSQQNHSGSISSNWYLTFDLFCISWS